MCEVDDLLEILGEETFEELKKPESVAVKTLREGAADNARYRIILDKNAETEESFCMS